MKTLLILLLFTFSCYAGKGHDFEENPGNSDPPTDECAFCDDEAPIPQGIYWFDAGVLFMKLYNAKNKQDEQIHLLGRN